MRLTRVCHQDSGRQQTVLHIAVSSRGTLLTFFKRRYRCKGCGSTYYEKPEWVHASMHLTQLLYYSICMDRTEMLSISEIAHRNCVTPGIVSSVQKSISFGIPEKLPETLCINEFKGDSGVILDILPKINAAYLKQYFRQYTPEQWSRVKYFCCDMHNGYTGTAKELFPHAIICINMFLVISRLNEAVDEVHRRLQNESRESAPETYKLLKHTTCLLKARESQLEKLWKNKADKKWQRLELALQTSPNLREVYDALPKFHHINAREQYALQRTELSDWLRDTLSSEVPELSSAASTVKHWRGYIQNSWKYGRSIPTATMRLTRSSRRGRAQTGKRCCYEPGQRTFRYPCTYAGSCLLPESGVI